MQQLTQFLRGRRSSGASIILSVLLTSCSLNRIPTVVDDEIESLVRREAAQIIAVSEDKERISDYRIFLSDFPRKDILGMSIGNRRIYISHDLAKLAAERTAYLWLLRQTLAHEIAHETAEHAKRGASTPFNRGTFSRGVSSSDVGLPWNVRFRNYSMESELEADMKGLGYWKELGWNCHIWVRILQAFEQQDYAGDVFHPTDKRLQQARQACDLVKRPDLT
jgi:predicted Zn-dependent protease